MTGPARRERVIAFLREMAEYLGLIEEDDAYDRWRCTTGDHDWGLWMHDVTPVPLVDDVRKRPDDQRRLGWTYVAIAGPSYRSCQRAGCAALERRATDANG